MEKIAVKYSDHLISDNVGIQEYYKKKFNALSSFLPYGAEIPKDVSEQPLEEFNLKPNQFYILVARLEPENSIEIILNGFCESNSKTPFIVVGGNNTNYGRFLKKKFHSNDKIVFIGGVYNIDKLNSLRKYAKLYFHGHTVGGTNPSLLEAMALGVPIVAHKNPFNSSVLEDNGDYFFNKEQVSGIINHCEKDPNKKKKNQKKGVSIIEEKYSWEKIIIDHEQLFNKLHK
jgi:glycosyltransferase involved in cell wall biosynthesis